MTAFLTPEGVKVEVVTLTHTSDNTNGQWFIVTDEYGYLKGKTQSPDGLAKLGIDLATLEEIDTKEEK